MKYLFFIILCALILFALSTCGKVEHPTDSDIIAYDTLIVRDVDYLKHRVFDLGRLPIDRAVSDTLAEDFSYDFSDPYGWHVAPGDSIVKLILYLDNHRPDTRFFDAVCHIDPLDTLAADPEMRYRTLGHFAPVDPVDFYYDPTHYFVLFRTNMIRGGDILAAYIEVLRRRGGPEYVDTIGDISGDTLLLKLIKPETYDMANHHVWEYEWKNVYRIGPGNMDIEATEVAIHKGIAFPPPPDPHDPIGQNGINYLSILGLDMDDSLHQPNPDGVIDMDVRIDPALGVLFFPNRHPFDTYITYLDDSLGNPVGLQDTVPEIYNTMNFTIQNSASKYYFMIRTRK